MKNNFSKIILLLIPMFFNSCNNITSPVIKQNLLPNPSFEENGEPSLSGWTVYDSVAIHFSNDVPPGGGKWSIYMFGNNPLSLQPILLRLMSRKVNLLNGNNIYIFSFWAKADSTVNADVTLHAFKNGSTEVNKDIVVATPNWTNYNIVDTLNSANYDSVEVSFQNGYSYVNAQGRTFFDLCSLTVK